MAAEMACLNACPAGELRGQYDFELLSEWEEVSMHARPGSCADYLIRVAAINNRRLNACPAGELRGPRWNLRLPSWRARSLNACPAGELRGRRVEAARREDAGLNACPAGELRGREASHQPRLRACWSQCMPGRGAARTAIDGNGKVIMP